jgi:butyrate kinase
MLNAMFIRRGMKHNRVARYGVVENMYAQVHQKFSGQPAHLRTVTAIVLTGGITFIESFLVNMLAHLNYVFSN